MNQVKEVGYIVSIDSGKAQTKWAIHDPRTGRTEKGVFSTSSRPMRGEIFGKIDTLIHYNSQNYSVGDKKDLKHVPGSTSKLTPLHEICVYTAVARALESIGANLNQTQSIHLCLNVPLHDYKSDSERKKYHERYCQEPAEIVSLTLNGRVVSFIVSELSLGYEGQGAMIHADLTYPNLKLDEGFVLLADIGGHNDSVILFENMAPVVEKNDALFNGVLQLFSSVAKTLTQKHDVRITLHDVELMSKGDQQRISQFKEFETIYKNCAEDLLAEICDNVSANTLNPRLTKFVFTGGGSQALKELIPTAFSSLTNEVIIVEDSQYANCLGALKKAMASYGLE